MRRILLVLAVTALMAVMMVAAAAPAFAKSDRLDGFFRCIALFEDAGASTGLAHSQCSPHSVARI